MRNPSRISKVLDTIKTIWEKNPDLRLSQLLLNAVPEDKGFYYLEDETLMEYLTNFYLDEEEEEEMKPAIDSLFGYLKRTANISVVLENENTKLRYVDNGALMTKEEAMDFCMQEALEEYKEEGEEAVAEYVVEEYGSEAVMEIMGLLIADSITGDNEAMDLYKKWKVEYLSDLASDFLITNFVAEE